jgi:integrase
MKFTGRSNTIRTKKSLFMNHIADRLTKDGSNLDELVAEWESKLQPATVKSLLYLAKDAVKDAGGGDLEIKSHIKRVGRSQQQKMVRALSHKEIVALSAVVKANYPKLFLPMMIALHTGMRRGEVWGLTYDDIDILNDTITVQRSYTGPTKSGKSRVIPISFALEKILLAELPGCSYDCIGHSAKRTESLVPSTFDPNPMLRRAAKQAGLRESQTITFHVLRHTFATLALESGVSPRLVSKTLGHAQVSTTLDIYWASTGEKINLSFLPDE